MENDKAFVGRVEGISEPLSLLASMAVFTCSRCCLALVRGNLAVGGVKQAKAKIDPGCSIVREDSISA